ncbi:GRAS family protein [Nannocystis pusilla]|uniref:GRAS family protein n=1 Tax=Nannocystis pusilla TaxID=889268 RepID=UPI003B80F348
MTFSLRRMLYEDRYKLILAACQDIRRHREQVAKTVIASQLLDALDVDVPSDALLSHIVAESLLRRIDRNLLSGRNLYLQAEKRPQIDLFTLLQRAIPAVPQGYALANQYLVHAMRQSSTPALLEIGIGKGLQIVALLRALARDPGKIERLRVIALEPNRTALNEGVAAIDEVRAELPFDIEIYPLVKLIEVCEDADYAHFEALAEGSLSINAAYTLHHTTGPDSDARTRLLRRLRGLRPRVFTLVEPSSDHDTEHLTRRMHHCWQHFATVFDLVDRSDASPDEKFAIKEGFFGREVRDILGTSDAFRTERHETLESWLLRLKKSGFVPYPAIDLDVDLPEYCRSSVSSGLVRLSYRGVPIIAVFAFAGEAG